MTRGRNQTWKPSERQAEDFNLYSQSWASQRGSPTPPLQRVPVGSEFRMNSDQSQDAGSVERKAHKEDRDSNYLVLSSSRADEVRTRGCRAEALLSLPFPHPPVPSSCSGSASSTAPHTRFTLARFSLDPCLRPR